MQFDPKRMTEIQDRMANWWKQGSTDRPLFVMKTESPIPAMEDYFPDVESRWLDIDKRLDYEELRMQNTQYHAEAFPGVTADLGPGSLALLLGSKPGYAWDTVWYHPGLASADQASQIVLQDDNPLWQWKHAFTDRALQRAAGRYRVELPDYIENFDTMCSLLGTEELLLTMMDEPEKIHAMQRQVLAGWQKAYNGLAPKLMDERGGMSVGGFNLWAPGRVAKLQCDIAIALSKGMFDEFALPYYKQQVQSLDYVLYHFDGPGALQHTETLLNMKEITAIQWQPGAGAPEAIDPHWYDLQQRILDSGKSIMIFMKPGDLDTLETRLRNFIRVVGKRGVLIVVEWSIPDSLANRILDASYGW